MRNRTRGFKGRKFKVEIKANIEGKPLDMAALPTIKTFLKVGSTVNEAFKDCNFYLIGHKDDSFASKAIVDKIEVVRKDLNYFF
jgi:hypothetical protein